MNPYESISVKHYERFVGAETIERLYAKARALQGARIAHVSSTYYGGGVAEILSTLTTLLNNLGITTEWRIIQGPPDFFGITKKMHNALQGDHIQLTERKKQIYEETIFENSIRNRLDHDFVVVHDPQPLFLIRHYRKNGPWIWRCHVDLSNPDSDLWDYLAPHIEAYDAVVVSIPEFRRQLSIPQFFFMPAIDPFTIKNGPMSEEEVNERLAHHGIPTDLPIVVQVSRFDRWKDPEGVIQAFSMARREVAATLVLLGNAATDDPEGSAVYESILRYRDNRVLIISSEDTSLVNALHRRAAVVLQKSIREGFGLTVTEAMWKKAAVIGGRTGGIVHQIDHGKNGFLVSSNEETAELIVRLIRDTGLRHTLGEAAHETVRSHFLMIRLLEQWVDLFNSFETVYRISDTAPASAYR